MLLSVFQKSKMSPVLAKGKRKRGDISLRSQEGVRRNSICESKAGLQKLIQCKISFNQNLVKLGLK